MKKRILISLIVLALLAAASGGGYWAYTRYFTQPTTTQAQTLKTATVSQGDILITADGSGNLLPSAEKTVSFQVSGTVAQVKVKVGDKVKAGDVLAKLNTLDLESTVREATYTLEQARLALQKAQRKAADGTDLAIASAALESARLGIVSAQGNYATAQLADITTQLQQAKFWNDFYQDALGDAWGRLQEKPGSEARLVQYEEAGGRAAQANASYLRIQQEYNNNLVAAQSSLVSARQAYLSAQSTYSDTKSSDPVKEAELTVLQAETKLTQAQANLQNATLTAPISGTVTAMTLETGSSSGTGSITLSDLDTPQVRFYVEESDYDKVAVGNAVSMTFTSLGDRVFTGKIVSVDPALVTESNTQAVQAYASVDTVSKTVTFLSGMSADVTVIAQETHNAALAPLEALRELTTGEYSVFVVQDDGTLQVRAVQVGLKDLVKAEITSGLTAGEVVSVGAQTASTQTTKTTTTTKSSTSSQSQNQGGPLDGGMGGPPPGGMP